VNDIVRRSDGTSASEKDLRKVYPKEGSSGQASKKPAILSAPSGSVVKASSDGLSDVSQVVSWEAGFVDNLSDVTNSLNISGRCITSNVVTIAYSSQQVL